MKGGHSFFHLNNLKTFLAEYLKADTISLTIEDEIIRWVNESYLTDVEYPDVHDIARDMDSEHQQEIVDKNARN